MSEEQHRIFQAMLIGYSGILGLVGLLVLIATQAWSSREMWVLLLMGVWK